MNIAYDAVDLSVLCDDSSERVRNKYALKTLLSVLYSGLYRISGCAFVGVAV
jgi:hypothetical protein